MHIQNYMYVDINYFYYEQEEMPDQWKESIIVPIHKTVTVIIIVGHHCYQFHTKFYQISFFHG
jgi:hypothetical protein